MAGKYDHIDFKPPKSVADAAARGLELRKKNKGRGGTDVGVQRAVNLKNRDELSPATVKRMKAFFDRHQKSKKVDKGKSQSEDKGYIAWMLWGGNPGYSWAKKVVRQMEAADKKSKKSALVNSLMKIANELDQKGLYTQADRIEDILIRLAKSGYEPTNKNLWQRAKAEARKKFKVYPSAYANLWASKWYKEKGGKWKKKKSYLYTDLIVEGGLREWLDEEWVDISRKEKGGKHPSCGRKDSDKGAYPKCRPKSQADKMSKKEKERATKQKRNEPNPKSGKGRKPTRDSHTKRD